MRLAAGYNVFDGLEILPYSLKSIRNCVNFIIVTWQSVSNFNNEHSEDIESILNKLKFEGLIDELIFYVTNLELSPHYNEMMKRNIGLNCARSKQFTHFLNLDCDELYIRNQFDDAKRIIEDNDYEATACKTRTYYKFPDVVIVPDEDHYVPFIHKVSEKKYEMSTKWNLLCDPTRKILCERPFAFDKSILQMHHLSHVRNDNLKFKMQNSSANNNFKHKIKQLCKSYEMFEKNQPCHLINRNHAFSTCETNNIYELIG